ncbi:unnamed protein product [Paramecium octaurelia]|uniref:Uncharacterized protein n=1 Tax=Paramecium octaurelia TaxID=43137 RepID=A0A8S1Y6D2_PAROT|nr:unnamed protein product [Paramecium octaurelia]
MEIDLSITNEVLTQISTQQLNNIITTLIHFNGENKPEIQVASQNTEKFTQCFSQLLQAFKISQPDIQTITNNQTSQIVLFKYQVINSVKEYECCFSACFNQDFTIMITRYMDGIFKVFEFNQGNIKLMQRLSQHNGIVGQLNFMNNSNLFVSRSLDNDIIIWNFFQNKQCYVQQKIIGHRNLIRWIVINKGDDLKIQNEVLQNRQVLVMSQTLNQHNFR